MPNIVARPRKGDRPDRPTTWRLTWELPLGSDGNRRRVRETFRGGKKEAVEHWTKRQAEISAQGKNYTPPSTQSVAEYLDHWLRTYVAVHLRPSTADSYTRLVRLHILPHLSQIPLADLTPQILQAWVADLSAKPSRAGHPLSPRTVSYARSILRDALAEAVRLGMLPTNPIDRVRPPKQQPKVVQSFTLDQVRALDRAGREQRLGPLFSFLWHTGLRIGEAIALRWEDVDLAAATLVVRRNLVEVSGRLVASTPKTAAGTREIALMTQTVDLLQRHLASQGVERLIHGASWNPDGLVFPSLAGTPLTRRNVTRSWAALRTAVGLPPYGLHALRHTAASLQLQAGVGVREIAATLGHENPGFTARIYAHVLEATKRQAAEKFSRLLGDDSSE